MNIPQNILAFCLLIIWGHIASAHSAEPIPVPEPKYEYEIIKSQMVPMRDGVELATDIYLPIGAKRPLPVILVRTPYGKNRFRDSNNFEAWQLQIFVKQGYAAAVQDKRGRYESEGEYIVSIGDGEDGYDTIDWLSKQPWSNGRVGMYGCSYDGDTQLFAAQYPHKALRAIIPQSAGSSVGSAGGKYRYFGFRNGGAVEFVTGLNWFYTAGVKIFLDWPSDAPPELRSEIADLFNPAPTIPDVDIESIWWSLPVIDLVSLGHSIPTDWPDLVSRSFTDPWWDQFDYLTDKSEIDVPTLHINSWYDFGIDMTTFSYNLFEKIALSDHARNNQFMVISPTEHCSSETVTDKTLIGDRDVGDARFDYWGLYLKWFDHFLKGKSNGVTNMPKVQYYVMGENKWHSADAWPIPGTEFTPFYLRSDGSANGLNGDGVLSLTPPLAEEPTDEYIYDPATPVPSLGGPLCCTGSPNARPGAYDQSDIEARDDVLVYTTPPLAEAVEVTGPLEVVLYVSSDARDTDFTAKLVDVYPDGTAYNIQETILRARYREGFEKEVLMMTGEVYEVRLDLKVTSNLFLPGHHIRLEISSSNFPRFERNLNTGGNNYDETEWVTAINKIHHNAQYPSRLILPIIQRKE